MRIGKLRAACRGNLVRDDNLDEVPTATTPSLVVRKISGIQLRLRETVQLFVAH